MAEETKIGWCEWTINCWEGCMKVGPGCDHCYAESDNKHWRQGANWGPHAPRRRVKNCYEKLNAASKAAIKAGHKMRVFTSSISDIFEKPYPVEGEPDITTHDLRLEYFKAIEQHPELTFLLLTKRPQNILKYIPEHWHTALPSNVWFGCTVVNQEEADRDIRYLLHAPGTDNKFLSIEPMLGPIELGKWLGISEIHHHEMYKERRGNLQTDPFKGDGDRRIWTNLENPEKAWIEEGGIEIESMQEGAGGKDHPDRVPASEADGEWQQNKSVSPQIGLVSPPRQHSRRIDHQPQERYQDGQQNREFGVNDQLGAGNPCNTCTEEKPTDAESEWGKEPFSKIERLRHPIDNGNEERGKVFKGNRGRIWHSVSNSVENSQGRQTQVSYVIVGGESGHGARQMNPEWARSIRKQCIEARIPFFFKQWGVYAPTGETYTDGHGMVHEVMARGKKHPNELDGQIHEAYPASMTETIYP